MLSSDFCRGRFLPGIVVDKFSDVLVVQSLALGIDRFKETIVELLRKVLAEDGITIRGVYERSDVKVRKQEGMEMVKGFIGPEFPTLVQIEENGVKYEVDVKDGQKTGFSWIRNITGLQFRNSVRMRSSGLLYTYRFFCTECGNRRSCERNRCGRLSAGSRSGNR